MQPDVGQREFDPGQPRARQAVQAVRGVRWVLLALLGFLGEIAWVTLAMLASGAAASEPGGGLQAALWILSVAAFACGARGTWQIVDAMDGGRLAGLGLVATFLLPYFRLLALMFVALLGLDAIQARGFRFSLWGPPARRAAPAAAGEADGVD